VLCHEERYDPVGVCRMCVVDVGARVYAAACVRPCEDGMEVKTETPEVETRRATLTQLLMADQCASSGTSPAGSACRCRVGSMKAHALLSEVVESGGGPDDVTDTIFELEKTMRLTSICGLGQVALGPAISVLGLERGATAARPQPRPSRPPGQAAGPPGDSPPADAADEPGS
jgi:hypothetical protein